MANDITGNPLKVDTASSTALSSYNFTAWMIRWVGATTAGHTISVQDKNGNVKYASEASGANYVEESHLVSPKNESLIFNGLKVPTLGSGIIFIYTDSGTPIKT